MTTGLLATTRFAFEHIRGHYGWPDLEAAFGPAMPGYAAQDPAEFAALLALYSTLAPRRVLEIGQYHGGSLHYWLGLGSHGARIVGVDTDHSTLRLSDRDDLPNRDDPRLRLIEGVSHSAKTIARVAKAIWPATHLDFVFIDGDHYGEGPLLDFLSYGPMVRSGGIIAFHDINWKEKDRHGVDLAWDYAKRKHPDHVELISDPEPQNPAAMFGIGILRVR